MRARDHGGSCILFLGRTLASSCPHGDDTSAVLGLRALTLRWDSHLPPLPWTPRQWRSLECFSFQPPDSMGLPGKRHHVLGIHHACSGALGPARDLQQEMGGGRHCVKIL